MNRINWLLAPKDLPLIPMQIYDSLNHFCGDYPEALILRISSILGQPQKQHRIQDDHYWIEYAPNRTAASICDLTATWLWRCLEDSHPKLIIEFGTGFSTFVIAAYVQLRMQKMLEKVEFISAEHDSYWYEAQSEALRKSNLLESVQLIYAPIETQQQFGQHVECYSRIQETIDALSSGLKADFIFVDGPLGTENGGVGRRGSLLQAILLIREGGKILLHDALRKEEYTAIRDYQNMQSLGFTCHGIVPVWYGLAICEKVSIPESLPHD